MASGVSFGIPALDGCLGPVAPGGSLLLENDPEVEALPWLIHAAAYHLKQERDVVFMTVSRQPERILAAMAHYGLDQGPGRLVFLDAHSGLLGLRSPEAFHIERPGDMESVLEAVRAAGRAHPGAVLLIEAVDTLLEHVGPDAFLEHGDALRAALQAFTFTAGTATQWTAEASGLEEGWDAVVALRGVEDRIVRNQVFAVERNPWRQDLPPPTLYRIARPGGVLAYIPKIVVVGPFGAGKTTFVHAVSDHAASVERMGTTVALDRGTMVDRGVQVEVFGSPGQERFDALLPMLARQAAGVILLVDATDEASFPRAVEMLTAVWRHGLTAVVALNKQDKDGAMAPEAARKRLDLPEGVPVVPCTNLDADSARDVVRHLVTRVLGVAP